MEYVILSYHYVTRCHTIVIIYWCHNVMTICHSSVTSCHVCLHLAMRYDGVYSSDSVSDRLMGYIYIIRVISYLVCKMYYTCSKYVEGWGQLWRKGEMLGNTGEKKVKVMDKYVKMMGRAAIWKAFWFWEWVIRGEG